MRPFDSHDIEQLRLAHARAEELRASWQTANYGRATVPGGAGRAASGLAGIGRAARTAAGHTLIGMGQRVLPVESKPCA
jgi:hypothetical protein